ncbi:hypothetical protein [Bradyrhizobium sp. Leo170]|uniref:hypothetical protein n=1 Tax=Bradyrhizobium sp. Leo170 TaxID=1571199 RepID=UPI00102E32BF|nr:hypothetical protein [Bradyrhizobium sp. Leo170]TAI67629.1 hypothetical protein CWO89_02090 [Bradyrhizobium sp. Leo170]
MAQTFFQDFRKDNGFPVTVEYSYRPGSETTYSPRFGAEGGDPCDICIIASWPNTPEYNRVFGILRNLEWGRHPRWLTPFVWLALQTVKLDIWLRELPAALSEAERERMEEWLIEHHVYEPSEEDFY